MTKREAKRRVCSGVVRLLDTGPPNEWLYTDDNGNDLSDADARRMLEALCDLVSELDERSGVYRRSADLFRGEVSE